MIKKNIFAFCLGVNLLIWVPCLFAQVSSQAGDQSKVFIQELKGDVQVTKAGETVARKAVQGDILAPQDKVQTGKASSAKIIVESAGEINLSKETTWSYEKYVVEQNRREFSAHLALGKLKAKVQKLPEGSIFEVKTPTSIAAVRGTIFGLFVYMVEQQFFTLLEVAEGAVAFSNSAGEQSYTIEEGHSATANEAGNVTPPQEIKSETEQTLKEEASTGESAPSNDSSENEGPLQAPETITESEPGQPEFEQETSGAQSSETGMSDEEAPGNLPPSGT